MHPDPILTEQLIIKACKAGSLKNQELLYKRFYGFAMGICLRYNLTQNDASETVNDTFIKVFNNLHQYNDEQPFKAWLRVIVVNTAIDRRRKELKHQLKADLNDAAALNLPASGNIISQLSAQDILKLMDRLPPLQRTIFNMHEIDGYSHEEVSVMLGIPASSSRVYLGRAKEKLKKVLISESESYGRSAE